MKKRLPLKIYTADEKFATDKTRGSKNTRHPARVVSGRRTPTSVPEIESRKIICRAEIEMFLSGNRFVEWNILVLHMVEGVFGHA